MNALKSSFVRIGLIFSLFASFLVPAAVAGEAEDIRVLVFSKTEGFRHGSIEPGIEALKKLGKENDLYVKATEDSAEFTPGSLSRFDVVVFLNTTGTLFDASQREAFKEFIRGGGGYVGIHSATDTEYDWEWYGKLAGAYFRSHPRTQEAVVVVEDSSHPATEHVSGTWTRTDEWYDFRENPRENVNVLLSMKPGTVDGAQMGDDHPMAWYHEFDGGRSFYTGFGHTDESFSEEKVLAHILGAIQWAAGRAEVEK